MADQYRIPKHEAEAEVLLPGQSPSTFIIFLGEMAETHDGPERPSDLFNSQAAFIPARDRKGGLVHLRRDAVSCVSLAASLEFGERSARAEEIAADQATHMHVEAILQDGVTVRGALTYLMPEGSRRLVDYLNLPGEFLALRDGDRARLINKHRIARISSSSAR